MSGNQGVKTDGLSSYIQLPQNVAGFGLKGGYELEFTLNSRSGITGYILSAYTNARTHISLNTTGTTIFMIKGNPAVTVPMVMDVQLGIRYKVRIEWDNGVAYGYVNDVLTATIPEFMDNSDGSNVVRVGCLRSSVSELAAITLHSMRQYVGNVNKAVYPCAEGTGTTLTDTSGNGNHGTIVGATWVLKKVPLVPRKNLVPLFNSGRFVAFRPETAFPSSDGLTLTFNPDILGRNGHFPLDVKANTNYYVSFVAISATANNGRVAVYNEDASLALVSYAGSGFTFNSGQRAKIRLYFRNETAIEPIVFSKVQLAEGITETPFEPYQLVNDVKSVALRPRKNLVPLFTDSRYDKRNGSAPSADGRSLTYTTTNAYLFAGNIRIPVVTGQTYRVSGGVDRGKGRIRIGKVSDGSFLADSIVTFPFSFVAPESTIDLSFDNNYTAGLYGTGTITFSDIQIEKGTIETPFEPYQLINDVKPMPQRPRKNLIPAYTDSRWTLHDNTRMAQSNFVGKVSGSTVENPHIAGFANSATLVPATTGMSEFGQTNVEYTRIYNIDGTSSRSTLLANGIIAQQRFSFNLIEHVLREHGDIFGSAVTTAARAAWLKANIAKINGNWYGFGSGPAGNKATWVAWSGSQWWAAGAKTHALSSVAKLTHVLAPSQFPGDANHIDDNGFVRYLAYADASDGVTASTINTDFVELEVVLTESAYAPVRAREPYKLTLKATAATLQNSSVTLPCLPNTTYSMGVTKDNANGRIFVDIQDANKAFISFTTNPTFTTPNNAAFIKAYLDNSAIPGIFNFDKPQLELAPATPWEPYTLINDVKPVALRPKKNLLQDFTKWTLFNKATTLATFAGKVLGSNVENPHKASAIATVSTPQPPSVAWSENTQQRYNQIASLDGTISAYGQATNNGAISQQLFAFNLIEQVQRRYNMVIPGADTAAKVAWLKANVIRFTCNWHGFGSSPTGNKATFTTWVVSSNSWSAFSSSHMNTVVTKLSVANSTSVQNHIDPTGFIYFLAYSDASDGVTASTVNTDYMELEVELTVGGSIVPNAVVDPVNPYKLPLNATANGQNSYSSLNVPPNADYTIKATFSGQMGIFSGPTAAITIVPYGGITTDTPKTFNTGNNNQISVYFSNVNLGVGDYACEYPQLELGTTATAWEPYQLINDVRGVR